MEVTIKRIRKPAPYRPRKVKEVMCRDWSEVTETFDNPGEESTNDVTGAARWIFRGHANSQWLLESSLVRTFTASWRDWAVGPFWNKAMVLKRMEGQMAFDFASKAQLHGMRLSVDKPVALLSAMQHFGAATRLLDWTYSPYVALYFALEAQCQAEQAAIWALNLASVHSVVTRKVLPVKKLKDGTRLTPPIKYVDFSHDENFKKHVLPDLEDYHRSLLIGEPVLNNVVPILPGAHNERLSAQQGLFLCPSQLGPSLMEQLEKQMEGTKSTWVVKIVVPRKLRSEILRRLFQMNVHALSLFPGVDGLGRFCTRKAELFGWGD